MRPCAEGIAVTQGELSDLAYVEESFPILFLVATRQFERTLPTTDKRSTVRKIIGTKTPENRAIRDRVFPNRSMTTEDLAMVLSRKKWQLNDPTEFIFSFDLGPDLAKFCLARTIELHQVLSHGDLIQDAERQRFLDYLDSFSGLAVCFPSDEMTELEERLDHILDEGAIDI